MGFRGGTETDVLQACLQLLRYRGVVAVRVNGGAAKIGGRYVRFTDTPGCADLLLCLPGGRYAAVEVKRPGGKLRPAQRGFLDDVLAVGGLAAVVEDAGQLDRLLAEWGIGGEGV